MIFWTGSVHGKSDNSIFNFCLFFPYRSPCFPSFSIVIGFHLIFRLQFCSCLLNSSLFSSLISRTVTCAFSERGLSWKPYCGRPRHFPISLSALSKEHGLFCIAFWCSSHREALNCRMWANFSHSRSPLRLRTPWPESASELHRPSDRPLSAKLVPTFADWGCHVVSVTDPYGRILSFSRPVLWVWLTNSMELSTTREATRC
jgi:hypothetical protein